MRRTGGLQLAPEAAFFASDAVHNARNVAEVDADFLLEPGRVGAGEDRVLVKRGRAREGERNNGLDQLVDAGILGGVARAQVVRGQVLGQLHDRPQHKKVGKVQVFQSLRVAGHALRQQRVVA